MFDFLSRGNPKASNSAKEARAAVSRTKSAPPSAAQREMVRLTLHSVLRQRGIPGNWLTCETIPVQIAEQGEAVLVQLVVLKWHDALMQYAPALQQGMLESLKQFDSSASASKYHFSWTFAPNCGCPYTQFPEPSTWNASTTPAPMAAIQAISAASAVRPTATKPKFDLPATAADLRKHDDDDDDHGFAATQINDL